MYCVELPMDSPVSPFELSFDPDSEFSLVPMDELFPGCVGISFDARRLVKPAELYSTVKPRVEECRVTAIPYALWQNRELSEMTVFMPFDFTKNV